MTHRAAFYATIAGGVIAVAAGEVLIFAARNTGQILSAALLSVLGLVVALLAIAKA